MFCTAAGSNSSPIRMRIVNCNTSPCPTWSNWSAHSTCSASCEGARNETSHCVYEGNQSVLCEGEKMFVLFVRAI